MTLEGVVISFVAGAIMMTVGSESTRTGAPACVGAGAGCTRVELVHAARVRAMIERQDRRLEYFKASSPWGFMLGRIELWPNLKGVAGHR